MVYRVVYSSPRVRLYNIITPAINHVNLQYGRELTMMRYHILICLTFLSISFVGCTKRDVYISMYELLSSPSSLNQGKPIKPYSEYEIEREELLGDSHSLAIKIQNFDDPLKVKDEILKLLLLGTNEGIAKTTMNLNGFSCLLAEGHTSTKIGNGDNFVVCEVSKDNNPAVKRRWTITLKFQ